MKPTMSFSIKTVIKQSIRFSLHMRQNLHILTLPVLELKNWVENQIIKNPLLEKIEPVSSETSDQKEEICFSEKEQHFSNKSFYSPNEDFYKKEIPTKESLFQHLMLQAREFFKKPEDLKIATHIIGNLNKKGFLDTPIEEIANGLKISKEKTLNVLEIVQTFDPPGIATKNLQESLLIQLKLKKKQNSLAFKIIKNHFEDLLNFKKSLILKKLKISEEVLQKAINIDIKNLNFHPVASYFEEATQPAIADITILYENSKWLVILNEKEIPAFAINTSYKNLAKTLKNREEKRFISTNILHGKWLLKALESRKKMLTKIALYIIETNQNFLLKDQSLHKINIKGFASHLDMHISTVYRAISNKFIQTPQGLFPLKQFFSSYSKASIDSKQKAIDLIKKLIQEEDKKKPLSDKVLSKKLSHLGISCARRTVAKYRNKLLIAPAKYRKK